MSVMCCSSLVEIKSGPDGPRVHHRDAVENQAAERIVSVWRSSDMAPTTLLSTVPWSSVNFETCAVK
jgi:hypothetical protein